MRQEYVAKALTLKITDTGVSSDNHGMYDSDQLYVICHGK